MDMAMLPNQVVVGIAGSRITCRTLYCNTGTVCHGIMGCREPNCHHVYAFVVLIATNLGTDSSWRRGVSHGNTIAGDVFSCASIFMCSLWVFFCFFLFFW